MDLLNCIEKFYSPAPDVQAQPAPLASSDPELELPVNPDANWPQTRIGPEAMLMRCEANLRFRNSSPERAQQRLASKCRTEFVFV